MSTAKSGDSPGPADAGGEHALTALEHSRVLHLHAELDAARTRVELERERASACEGRLKDYLSSLARARGLRGVYRVDLERGIVTAEGECKV